MRGGVGLANELWAVELAAPVLEEIGVVPAVSVVKVPPRFQPILSAL
jgi:hypothetical protein